VTGVRSVVVIGNPANRRVAFFQAALARFGLAPAVVVPWIALARGEVALAPLIAPGSWLRIESPGEDFDVERALLALGAGLELGARGAPTLDADAARALAPEHGRLRFSAQHHAGFVAALRRIEAERAAAPPHVVTSHPDDVAIMFDKRLCHARCVAAGVSVPEALGPVGSWEQLRARMIDAGRARVFVKLAFGSSASGVVALAVAKTPHGVRVRAHTSVELVRSGDDVRLYNSLCVRRYDDERDVATIVDHLTREGVHVEVWIPKAGLDGHTFDLRVVVIAGRARHVIARLGHGPMTNLHLGNRRAPAEHVRAALGEERWASILRTAEAGAAVFPRTLHVGVDLLVHATRPDVYVAEVNAFGDLLPNVLDDGLDTYGAEVEALSARTEGLRPPDGGANARDAR
jgi:hypothetical protein